MSFPHYHVIMNTPGYLPETDPTVVLTRKKAIAVLQEMLDQLRDSFDRPIQIGKVTEGLVEIYDADNPNSTDTILEIQECYENRPGDCEIT